MARRKSTAESLFALANVLTAASAVLLDLFHGLEWAVGPRSQREQLHEQGLRLKNQLTAEKIQHEREKRTVTLNREVVTGLDIDRRTLAIRREEFKQVSSGILPAEQAQFYRRPTFTNVD